MCIDELPCPSTLRPSETNVPRPTSRAVLKRLSSRPHFHPPSPLFPLSFLLVLLLALAPVALAATYYVDATGGRDTNAGLSEATAWKTIAKINASHFLPGDQILFKRGGIWREQLNVPSSGSSGNPITVGAYGSGAMPIINGADVMSGWTSSGPTNVYQVSLGGLTGTKVCPWFNGTHGNLQTSAANLANDMDFYTNTTSGVLYIYSATSPSGRTIEVSARPYGINTKSNNYLTIQNLSLIHTYDWGAGVAVTGTSQYITINNSDLSNNFYVGLLCYGPSYGRVTLSNSTILGNGTHGVEFWDGFSGYVDGGYHLVTLNTVANNGWRGDAMAFGIAGKFSNSTLSYNTVYNNGSGGAFYNIYNHGIYATGGNGVNTIIKNNTTYGQLYGSGIKLTGSGTVKNNISYNNTSAGIQIGTNATHSVTANVLDNICYGNGYGIAELNAGTGTINLIIYNNTLYNNTNTAQVNSGYTRSIMVGDNNLASLIVKNNILNGSSQANIAVQPQSSMVWDYNIVYPATIYYKNSVLSWSQWQEEGFDTHGVSTNPLFVSTSTSNFQLQAGSPAIYAGVNVGLTTDYAGNTVHNPPSIGAHEYGEGTVPDAPRNLRVLGQ